MSKAEISAAERSLVNSQEELRVVDEKIAHVKLQLAQRREVRADTDAEHQTARARKVTLHSVGDDARGTLEQCRREQEELTNELADCDRVTESDRAELDATVAAYKGLKEAWDSLNSVRAELEALAGESAKTAALEVAGGELPTDIVPAPAPQVGEEACSRLWADSDGVRKEMTDDLRQALQSQAVIVALQRSLAVRAAEMREGLRQWGFARSATVRTEELCKVLEGTQRDAIKKTEVLRAECQHLMADQRTEGTSLGGLQKEDAVLQQKHTTLLEQLHSTRDASARMQGERDAGGEATEDIERQHEQLNYDHDEAAKELEMRRAALAEHPAEAERRLSAGERLARMSKEQAERSFAKLQQTQEELLSWQQENQRVKEAHMALGDGLVKEKLDFQTLTGDHEKMNLDLEALARHYIAALPPLPGIRQFSEKIPNSPPGIISYSDTGVCAGSDVGLSPIGAKGTIGDKAPEHPRQPTHIDPTGEGALSAGGRLVMSL